MVNLGESTYQAVRDMAEFVPPGVDLSERGQDLCDFFVGCHPCTPSPIAVIDRPSL